MKKMILVVLTCLIGQLFNCSIFAQEEIDLGEIVVTATKTEKEIRNVPASVSVIKEDEIKNNPSHNNVNDLVKNTLSIDQRNFSGMATVGTTAVSIRGMGLRSTLILLDGQVLNDSLNNFVIFNLIPKDNIEKIEIVRGPFSALYGTSAAGGVINVITRDKFTKKSNSKLERGNFSYKNFVILQEDTGYSLNFERKETDNYLADKIQVNRDYSEDKLGLKISKFLPDNSKINFSFNYLKTKAGYGLTENILPQKEIEVNKRAILSSMNFKSQTKKLKYKINLSVNIPQNEYISESIDPNPLKYVPSINNYSSSDFILNLEGNILPDNKNNLTFGSDISFLKGKWEIKNAETGILLSDKLDKKIKNYALYLQDEIEPIKNIIVIAGFRFDKHQQFGSEFSPKISLNYKLKNTSFYSSYGKAFRAPSLGELYSPPFMRVPGRLHIGNPDLKPEIINAIELGTKTKIKEVDVRMSLYQNKARDLMQMQREGKNDINRNIGKAKTEGIEIETLYKANKDINLSFNYSYLEAKDLIKNEMLEYSPYNKANFGILREFKNFDFNTYFNFVDKRFYVDRKTGKKFKLESYVVSDLSLIYKLNNLTNINLTAKNLFNKTYQEYGGYNAPKRQMSWGIIRSW